MLCPRYHFIDSNCRSERCEFATSIILNARPKLKSLYESYQHVGVTITKPFDILSQAAYDKHMDPAIKNYLSSIGRIGGAKSKRRLSATEAKAMVRIREAKRAFKQYYTECFWHLKPDLKITRDNIHIVVNGLKNYGDRKAFFLAHKLSQ